LECLNVVFVRILAQGCTNSFCNIYILFGGGNIWTMGNVGQSALSLFVFWHIIYSWPDMRNGSGLSGGLFLFFIFFFPNPLIAFSPPISYGHQYKNPKKAGASLMDPTTSGINYASLFISGAAAIVAILSFYFAIKSWRETNRPIVIARVTTRKSGDVATLLNLVLENTGNRPAKNVRLRVNRDDLASVMLAEENNPLKSGIENCFSANTFIPILDNGRQVSNSFGMFSINKKNSTWRPNSVLPIRLFYEDLDGRKFNHNISLLIADDTGFAGTFWEPA
jgi:hypothetical protein